jgi:hypothetical protein
MDISSEDNFQERMHIFLSFLSILEKDLDLDFQCKKTAYICVIVTLVYVCILPGTYLDRIT